MKLKLLSRPGLSDASTRNARSLQLWVAMAGIVALGLVLLTLPGALGPYGVVVATQVLAYCVVALSLQLLWGRAGQLSFGHAAFFGIGAFGYSIVAIHMRSGGWIAILIAIAVPLVVGLLLGYFLFFGGVRGAYFSIVTLAFAIVTSQLAISWSSVTGGDSGLTGVPGLTLTIGSLKADFTTRDGSYFLAVAALVIALVVAATVRFGSLGLILAAIRENETRVTFCGYNTSLYLTAALGLSAAMAGLAGGTFAAASNYAAPDMLGVLLSVEMLTWVAVGGRNYMTGAIIGTVVMWKINSATSTVLPNSWPLVVGIFFVVVVLFMPSGLVGLLASARRWLVGVDRSKGEVNVAPN
jgi:urea transport system permease protein